MTSFQEKHGLAVFHLPVKKKLHYLVEVMLIHSLSNVPDLTALVSLSLPLVEFFSKRFQFSEGHLKRKAVGMSHWCVF